MRHLSDSELMSLKTQGCTAEDWNNITVADDFDAGAVMNCRFMGNVEIEGGVYIHNIGSFIRNCRIKEGAYIENVAQIDSPEGCRFGNGVRVSALNEGGGRETTLFNGLDSQVAYMLTVYRHRNNAIKSLEKLIEHHIEQSTPTLATIGRGARITNCGVIEGVTIGDRAVLDGIAKLENGTVLSSTEAVSHVGTGVNMRDFIIDEGGHVDNGAVMSKCFVGQGVHIGAFSATDSLFFANTVCENGEACSIFAGPYTVSHHKSTLLIAGMFSFFNAGSGTNQSNHLFKTGAVHQGIHQRGCKYGSNAYMMLPARDGAFTVILGSHKCHPDTEKFPYSYLLEEEGNTYLLPAQNLSCFGTVRDIAKWPLRDTRKGTKRDRVNFSECNPFVCERIIEAIDILADLAERSDNNEYCYGRMRISRSSLSRGINLYTLAKEKFMGTMLAAGKGTATAGCGHWIDAAGMFVPEDVMNAMLDDLDNEVIGSVDELGQRLSEAHAQYDGFAYNWAYGELSKELGHEATENEVAEAIARGSEAGDKLKKITDSDRCKDFAKAMRISYGEGSCNQDIIDADFNAVRGE